MCIRDRVDGLRAELERALEECGSAPEDQQAAGLSNQKLQRGDALASLPTGESASLTMSQQAKIAELEQKLADAERELDQKAKDIHDMNEAAVDLCKVSSELRDTSTDGVELRDRLKTMEMEAAQLQERNEELEALHDGTTAALQRVEEENKKLKLEAAGTQRGDPDLDQEQAEWLKAVGELELKLKAAEKDHAQVVSELEIQSDAASKRAERWQETAQELEGELEELQQLNGGMRDLAQSTAVVMAESQEKTKELKKSLKAGEEESARLKKSVFDLEQNLNLHQAAHERAAQAAEQEHAKAVSDLEAKDAELLAASNKVEQLNQDVHELECQLKEQQELSHAASQRAEGTGEALQKLIDANKGQKQKLYAAEQEAGRLGVELKAAKEGRDKVAAELEGKEAEMEAANKKAEPVSYTHLRAHETPEHLVCRLLLEKKKKTKRI
eukprot:TRINITY_DN5976_c0_g1_i1.p1 TRINITY_DN5976_c0_g1~~TRINITY_DN5976_c0_g1_i1.p1  ORF type:complete len:443 (-),score=147.71 TRINITY_DN5976_c0_g1_i1:79-1407(-)